MTAEQFVYWLQGFTELTGGTEPTAEQWRSINDHLGTVFVKVTPPLGGLVGMPATARSSSFTYEDYLRRNGSIYPILLGGAGITC